VTTIDIAGRRVTVVPPIELEADDDETP
jgi:hypothetical protein